MVTDILLRKVNPATVLTIVLVSLLAFNTVLYVYGASTSTFTQVINAGTLSVDIVDGSYNTVGSPGVTMNSATASFTCQTSTGSFGSASEQIYVQNPDAADNGWSVTVAASDPTDVWDSAGTDFDFNDATSSGCSDGGGDTDSLAGQMTVDASGATLDTGQCSSCTTTSVTLGSSDAFDEGSTDSITIVTGASGSDDIGDWTVQGVSISQTIPSGQPAASDYTIDMTLTIAAS